MQSLAEGLGGRGEEINSSFAIIQPFVEDANKLVTVANSQEGALTASIHNTGVVFDALTAREGEFRGLISNGERAFHAFAGASQAFAETGACCPHSSVTPRRRCAASTPSRPTPFRFTTRYVPSRKN